MSEKQTTLLQFKNYFKLFEFKSLLEKHTQINFRSKLLSCHLNERELKLATEHYGAIVKDIK